LVHLKGILSTWAGAQYENYTIYSKKSPFKGEAPQNHSRESLLIYGIIIKKDRRKRCQTPNRVRGNV